MKFISCDQSTSHCALIVWENNKPIERCLIKTGSTWSKVKQKDVIYFDLITEQINYVCQRIVSYINTNKVDKFIYESPSQGSYGDAKATLITLFRAIEEHIISKTHLTSYDISSYAPTSVKKYARQFLPKEEQGTWEIKTNKNTGELVEVLTKAIKMEKSHMIKACEAHLGGWLDGLTLAAGKADYADAYWIGQMFLNNVKPTKKEFKSERTN